MKKAKLVCVQEFCRIYRFPIAGHTEAHMLRKSTLHKGSTAHGTDRLSKAYLVTGLHKNLISKACVVGGVAVLMADHNSHPHCIVFIDRIDFPIRCGCYLCSCQRRIVAAIMDSPIPGGLVITQALHGIFCHHFPLYRGCCL